MSDTAVGVRPPTPFKELDFFVEADEQIFAGRERETRQLVSRIVNSRAVVVHARSGLGKTSLLRAGVMPLLIQQNLRPVYVRMLDSLLGDLADAVAHSCQLPPLPPDGVSEQRTRMVLEAASANAPLVLMLDQFEEFFTRFEGRPRDRQAFVQFIADVIHDAKRDVRVVFSLREDYLYALDEFQRRLPNLFAQAFRLLPLTALGARAAITRPLLNEKVAYDEALITQLVDELTAFDFDSARLQVTCSEVYRHALAQAPSHVALRPEDLDGLKESAGAGLRGIYKKYLREAVANIQPPLHLESKLLLDKLISTRRTKFAVGREALLAEFANAPQIDRALTALDEQKLVRSEIRGGKRWVELRHECLVDEILEWFKEDIDFDSFRFVRGLIEENSRDERFRTRPERLLTAGQLKALLPFREHLRLAPQQFEYVFLSAVYTDSSEVPTWAQSNPEFAKRLLRSLSTAPTHMQGAALRGIGQLGAIDPEFSASILGLAFDDSLPAEVREAAQQSAALIATDEDLTAFQKREMPKAEQLQLRELLADLYIAGRLGTKVGRWKRRSIKRHVIRRRSWQFLYLRKTFIGRGIWGGLLGAVIFSVSTAIFAMLAPGNVLVEAAMETLRTQPPLQDETLFGAMFLGTAYLYIVMAGALIGWRNGVASFKTCALGDTRWWPASLPSFPQAVNRWSKVAIGLLFLLLSIYTMLWLLIRVAMAGLVFLLEPLVRRRSTSSGRAVLASFICVMLGFAALGGGLTGWLPLVIFMLLALLNIELCSFALAIPDKGIPGALPVRRAAGLAADKVRGRVDHEKRYVIQSASGDER